ncbi:MAG: hypothetical protein IPO81_05735 [Kouleothrix sp.]|nr:hypothetical protein [Kouleothrix sp.]
MKRKRFENYRRFLAAARRMAWPIVRQVVGWILIALGLLGLVLPVLQGVLFLVLGIALVGRRNIVIRYSSVALKRFLRRWAALPTPLIGPSGRVALRAQRQYSRQSRHLHRRYAAWSGARARRRAMPLAEGAQDSRYEQTPERV